MKVLALVVLVAHAEAGILTRKLLQDETPPEDYQCSVAEGGKGLPPKTDCFFEHDGVKWDCKHCCDTGLMGLEDSSPNNGSQFTCWNDAFSPQACCDMRSPVNLPETRSPNANEISCPYNKDPTCWGNGFKCEECCTQGWIWISDANSPTGVSNRSCWVESLTGNVINPDEDALYFLPKWGAGNLEMSRQRCCQPKPTSRPPANPPTRSPTRFPTPSPTTNAPTDTPTTPTPTASEFTFPPTDTLAPTIPSCDRVFCPKSVTGPNYKEPCTDFYDNAARITTDKMDFFWTKKTYPPNIFCTWTIYGTPRNDAVNEPHDSVTLRFDSVDMEANYDFMKIYDGAARPREYAALAGGPVDDDALRSPSIEGAGVPLQRTADGRIPLKYISCDAIDMSRPCYTDANGNMMLPDIVAPTGVMYVTFKSDGSLERTGFNATFYSGIDALEFASKGYGFDLEKLNKADIVINDATAAVVTPDYEKKCALVNASSTKVHATPGNTEGTVGTGDYGVSGDIPFATCTWEINSPSAVTLTFETFATEAGSDTVTVYDGDEKGAVLLYDSGTIVPTQSLTAKSGKMTIVLRYDWETSSSGFRAKWKTDATAAAAAMVAAAAISESSETNPNSSAQSLLPIAASLAGIVAVAIGAIVAYRLKKNRSGARWTQATKVQELECATSLDLQPGCDLATSAGAQSYVPEFRAVTKSDELPVPAAPTRAWET